MYEDLKGEELQKELDASLAETKRICAEIIQTMASCKEHIDSIDKKLDRLTENVREENRKNDWFKSYEKENP